MRARISRTCTGLRTTSSTPAANRSSVSFKDFVLFIAMTAAADLDLILTGTSSRFWKSPRRNASTASISGSGAVLTHWRKSCGANPVAETPSRENHAVYPFNTVSRSSTMTIMRFPRVEPRIVPVNDLDAMINVRNFRLYYFDCGALSVSLRTRLAFALASRDGWAQKEVPG